MTNVCWRKIVLDALAALNVASSVVQSVDFSVKVISKGNKYYRSADGALVENTELVATVETFRRLNDGLTKSLWALLQAKSMSNEEALQSVKHSSEKFCSRRSGRALQAIIKERPIGV